MHLSLLCIHIYLKKKSFFIDDDFQDFQSAPPMPSSQRSSISQPSGLQNNSVPSIQPITNLKLVQPISNVQSPTQPNVNASSGINNNLLDDFLGPISTPPSTNLPINTQKPSSTSSNTSQPINAFNTTKPISPTTPKQVSNLIVIKCFF
jgi:hypothetical protein